MPEHGGVLEHIWRDLGEDEEQLGLVAPGGHPALRSNLPVAGLTRGAVAAASLSAALLAGAGTAAGRDAVSLDPDRILTAVTSDRHFRLNGQAPQAWAELSGFWRAGDGWIRTHANYPHHRSRLLAALNLPETAGAEAFASRISSLDPLEAEGMVARAGGVAAAVRDPAEWSGHPQAEAVRAQPLVGQKQLGGSPAPPPAPAATDTAAPLAGLRVLDLTRVIAGPVATRTLALLGADVLRVDTPELPEIGWQHLDTGAGKRTTLLDLHCADGRRTFEGLLQDADVLVTGYRPQSLAGFGLAAEELAERRPGLVMARISAWGTTGPWAGRRGFDSIVQAAAGIARIESPDGIRPGALPAQALDHSAGYMLAAAVLSSLRRRRREGGTWLVEVSLARTAQELLSLPPDPAPAPAGAPRTVTVPAPGGSLTYALPAIAYTGGPPDWPAPSRPWGTDDPAWT